MKLLISLCFALLLVGIAAWKIFRANRLIADLAREKEMRRQRREREILARLDGIRKKTDRDFAEGAIEKDPKRAAKVVSGMMKKG